MTDQTFADTSPSPAQQGAMAGGFTSGTAGVHSEEAERAFVEYLVKSIVDEPNEVSVTRTVDDLGVLITLKVGKNDMGKIIGKSGQTAKALRTLIRVFGSKNSNRVNLKILEPETM